MPDLRAYARGAATRAGCDPDLFERQIQQESGFDPDAYNQGSGATGIAQIVSRFHPDVDPRDPIASLEYAARWMATLHRQYGSYQRALAAYNWGPGNVGHWNGRRDSLPAETAHYLDVILGPGWPEPTSGAPTMPTMKLSEVLARGRSRIGDPYVWGGKAPPSTDCSGFVAWCNSGQVTSFTDTILGETQRVETPAPGDIVLYEYTDPDQPGVRFPHVGLYLSDTETLDNRYGLGVGVHPQLSRARAARYYRRVPNVVVDTIAQPAPVDPPTPLPPAGPAASSDAETIAGLRVAVAQLADVTVAKAAQGAKMTEEALAEALRIREQFVGPRPHA